jgi:hypothetical protein
MKSKQTIIFMILMTVLLVGCSKQTAAPSQMDTPPLPIVTTDSREIAPVVQSSYCWKNGCADYAGGKVMVEDKPVTVIEPGETIKIYFDYKPIPTNISLGEFTDKDATQVPLDNGTFKSPDKRGIYYYGISANWLSKDGKTTNGDTSAVFAIEVKSKFSAEEIKSALEAESIELTPKELENDWVLNKVKPLRFIAIAPNEKTARPEHISIYIFDSEEERKEGLADFNKQKEMYDMAIPLIYELDNSMIFYWHHSDMNGGNPITKFDEQIKTALTKL